jgi:hypothetical protein
MEVRQGFFTFQFGGTGCGKDMVEHKTWIMSTTMGFTLEATARNGLTNRRWFAVTEEA